VDTHIPIPPQSLAGDSGSGSDQGVGAASSLNEIVQFGKRAQARFGEATREGFYGIIDTKRHRGRGSSFVTNAFPQDEYGLL
jgi:hypothetical protein